MLVYVFAIVSLGTFLISTGANIPDFNIMARLLSSVYLLALATYLYNDLTDYKVDLINNREIVFDSKTSKYYVTLYSMIGFFAISVLLAFSINFGTGIGSLSFLTLALVYSHPRTHFKGRFIVKTAITAAGGCIASIMGSLATENISYISILTSSIVFLFWFILGPLGDIGDIKGDEEAGRRTIPIVIGIKRTFMMMIGMVSFIGLLIFFSYYSNEIHEIGMILGFSVCGFAIYKLTILSNKYENKILIKKTRTTMRYSVFAIQIMLEVGLILNYLIRA